ncbi:MAG: hypothetical protein ACRDTI_11280 [Mycobacterium sp.]
MTDVHGFDPLLSAQRQIGVPPNYLHGCWGERNPLNIPGPFYGAATDDCADGPLFAPETLSYDHEGRGYVWRQPIDDAEVQRILEGMYSDPYEGFAWDGNEHWTPALVREWWADRHERADLIGEPVHYPEAEMAYDLRRYLYFLDAGRSPEAGVLLPELWS